MALNALAIEILRREAQSRRAQQHQDRPSFHGPALIKEAEEIEKSIWCLEQYQTTKLPGEGASHDQA